MNAFYSEIASGILQIVCALISILLTAVVVPWLKTSAIPWMKEKQLYGVVKKFVQAAEKLAETGALEREDKKKYVINLLEQKGYHMNAETEAFIESAVKELDMSVEVGFGEILDAFEVEVDDDDPESTEATGEVVG